MKVELVVEETDVFEYCNLFFIDRSKGNTTVIPSEKGSLHIYNGFDCDVVFNSSSLHTSTIGSLEMINLDYIPVTEKDIVEISLWFSEECTSNIPENFEFNTNVTFVKGKVRKYSYKYYYNLITFILNLTDY